MKQIFVPNIQFKFDKIRKYKTKEYPYIIAVSSRGLYNFQNNTSNKIIENTTKSYSIEVQTNDNNFKLFINEICVDSLCVSNLPLDIIILSIKKEIYKFQDVYIHVESQHERKRVWFQCKDNVTTNSIVEEMSLIIPLINV